MITHPEKLMFPDDGITKGDLAAYYESMAPLCLPHLRGRPLTMERYPSGIGEKGFWQKDVSKGFPEWLERVDVPKKKGVVHYPIVNDLRSLLWVTNQNTITQHVWTSRVPELQQPDLCIFDLDPPTDEGDAVRRAALALRDLLHELGVASSVKTSGSKGFHIAVRLDDNTHVDEVARFAHGVGALFVARFPELMTLEFNKVDRSGRIYMDTGRNGYGATVAAPYTVRAKPGAPVSAPCSWQELEEGRVHPGTFTLRNMRERVGSVGDLWADLLAPGPSLEGPLDRLQQFAR